MGLEHMIKTQHYDNRAMESLMEALGKMIQVPLPPLDTLIDFNEDFIPQGIHRVALKQLIYSALVAQGYIVQAEAHQPIMTRLIANEETLEDIELIAPLMMTDNVYVLADYFNARTHFSDEQKLNILKTSIRDYDINALSTLVIIT